MTNFRKSVFVSLILLTFNTLNSYGYNNKYGISDKMYGYVQRFRMSRVNSSLIIADSLYIISREVNDTKLQCVAMLLQCEYYYYHHDLEKLLQKNDSLHTFAIKTGNKELIFEPWGRVISYYLNSGTYTKAYDEIMAFQREALASNSEEGIGMSYRNLGNFYQVQHNPKLAVEQYSKGADYYLERGNYKNLFLFYCSAAFSSLGYDADLTEKYAGEALKLTPKYGNRIIPLIYKFAAETKKDDLANAVKTLSEINELKQYYHLVGSNREIYFKYLTYYSIKQGNIKYAKRLRDSLNNTDDLLMAGYHIAEAEGDYKSAFDCMSRRYKYNDSLNNGLCQSILADIVAGYNTSHLEYENARLKMHRTKMIFIFGSSLAAIVFLFLIIYIQNRRRTVARLRAEQKIANEARQAAEHADDLKSLFFQNMSHEIRTPLNAIIGFTDLLHSDDAESLTQEEKDEFKHIIHTNTNRLLNLISDILDLSKLESEEYALKYEKVNINELCSEIASSIQAYVPEGVLLEYQPCKGFEDVSAEIDKQRVRQTLSNYLTNACKYTSEGSITLTYNVKEKDHNMLELEFSVTDTGCGIPIEKRGLLFQKFEKLNSNKPGSGMGLYICMSLALQMKGMASIDPEYVNGSRFLLTIPAEKVI